MWHRIAAIGCSALVSTFLAGCSAEPSAAASAASSTPSSSPTATQAPNGAPQAAGQPVKVASGRNASLDPAEYVKRCKDEVQPSLGCEALRSRVVADVVVDLRNIFNSRDKRGAKQALAALEFEDEPEIIVGASRILGRFPETPGLVEKMLPFLDSKFIQVQSMASSVLMAIPGAEYEDLGRMWIENHRTLHVDDAYDEYPDFPAHYASMGFPKYPGAQWFSPADSDRSIGSSTTDDVAKVAKWYGDTLHAEPLDYDKWNQITMQQTQLLVNFDPAAMARMQQVLERMLKGDQAAAAELEKLQKKADDDKKKIDEALENSITNASLIASTFARDARWIIAAKKGERISRLIVVFPIPSLHRTVVKQIWDLSDFPSAWPERESGGDR